MAASDLIDALSHTLDEVNAARTTWTLEQGVKFVQNLERAVFNSPTSSSLGVHVGLTGGVLYNGKSKKDLDVMVYPHNTTKLPTAEDVHNRFIELGLVPFFEKDRASAPEWTTSRPQQNQKTGDQKLITLWKTQSGKRIDFFFVDFPKDWFKKS